MVFTFNADGVFTFNADGAFTYLSMFIIFVRSFSSMPPLCLKNSLVLTDIFQRKMSKDFIN